MAKRVVVFIDEKNCYNGARRAFFRPEDHFTCGNFDPIKLGQLLCSWLPRGAPGGRSLHQVRIYTGRPDATREPKGYAAHMKQCTVWERGGAVVIARTLRYPPPWAPSPKPQQKGVDVALAVDLVAMAIDDEYDVGIVASTDSDLRPALEYVLRKFRDIRQVEVTSWRSDSHMSRLSVPGALIWCHRLYRQHYDAVADLTDYTR
jgi:uncharacterized LabA/DUF88 family protein